MPLYLWDDAFVTACYLINIMPNPSLRHKYPFEVLFHTPLDYKFLKVFGSACWPNLRQYNPNKLQPRSLRCVFMGYNLRHKGYKCLHTSTNRVYYSRDVLFKESVFPFAFISSQSLSSRNHYHIFFLNHILLLRLLLHVSNHTSSRH